MKNYTIYIKLIKNAFQGLVEHASFIDKVINRNMNYEPYFIDNHPLKIKNK